LNRLYLGTNPIAACRWRIRTGLRNHGDHGEEAQAPAKAAPKATHHYSAFSSWVTTLVPGSKLQPLVAQKLRAQPAELEIASSNPACR
jgi:hypothetical protein